MTTERSCNRKSRPVNLNLATIRFPVTAIASILHRLSGLFLFILLPFILWAFNDSLSSSASFITVQEVFSQVWLKFLLWLGLTSLAYHLFAGIRHFIMSFGYAESLRGGRAGAYLVMLLTLIFALILGIALW